MSRPSHQQRAMCDVPRRLAHLNATASALFVGEIGYDITFVEQSSPGMPVESFLRDEELERTALSCRLAMDLLCQVMQAAWHEHCRKVGNDVLKDCASAVPFFLA